MTRRLSRAVFLDRDGIINELVYYPDHGIVDSPSNPDEFRLVRGIGRALSKLKALNFKLILVSNQPGVAKGHFSMKVFKAINRKMELELRRQGVGLDGEYYCMHHPQARLARYRVRCGCRKPKPGLILKSARKQRLKLRDSFVIGDGLVDVLAGKRAGCTTMLVGGVNSLVIKLMNEMKATPDYTARNIEEAVGIIINLERGHKTPG